ncbi:glycosyl hydrolase [Dysgonomonas sp. 520]|uniref:PKD domain-containing protein n=1 Tax=Dysgonomonas sp. 520 TaxID=2302931 RepID=UPI0013D24FA1|nr:glycosyl hydrolase [Dysgonomonas sp. 520]NDW10778.1 T9SS C-terminal target domain-containing protein [Dysgonomonas sp. 520]
MKRFLFLLLFISPFLIVNAQRQISVGKGSYAEYPPESVAYDDGYFAHPAKWFELAWDELNLHENVKGRPIPTNDWWTEFIFRGTGRIQPEYHVPPVTVTTDGDRFGSEAWAYPYMLTASAEGFNVFYPKGFDGGGMNRGTPLKVNGTTKIQANNASTIFADFESATWPEGWMVTTNSDNIPGPMATSEISQSPTPNGYIGDRFVNTFKGDAAKFSMTSPSFTVDKDYIRMYVGGGNYPDETYVGLFVDGQRVRYSTGENSGTLTQKTWDVKEYKGKQAEIRIVDNSGGGWGFIMCDEIIFTDNEFGGSGYTPDFKTASAKVYDWNDLGFTLRSENNGKLMDATLVHGVPFMYVEMKDIYPILAPESKSSVYNVNGELVDDFPANLNTFTIEYDGRVYGVHAPSGSKIHRSNGGDYQVEISGSKRYVVISVLPDRSFLKTYDQYARNKPGDVRFNYEYKVEEGKIVTTFDMDAQNLDNGAKDQEVLMSFLPHHYRTTNKNFNFISGADYQIFRGKMQTAASKSFSLSYNFGGMPPYLPEPLDLAEDRQQTLSSLLDYSSQHYTVNGNTYAKGLGENSTLMLMAKSLGHSGFDQIKNNLKNEFVDWYTFDESERNAKQRFFAQYPNFGAMIGFPPGYGSQGFNDVHFHNGYFAVGTARLMMVDKEFKRDYAGMAKLVARNYANWERWEKDGDTFMPFLRTFDPYLGHSFAGGIGDGGGNNQESTSEAINSWFGIYMLGVELNDKKIIDAGAMGYMLEVMSAGEYWLDLYDENFPSTYEHDYVGIVRTDNLAWATYFAGDPAWVLGIQACPVDFFYTNFGLNPEKMTQINQSMFHDRTTFYWDEKPMHDNDDPYDNIRAMGPYLGGYHLNIMNYTDPENAAQWIDKLCKQDGEAGTEWRNHPNTTTNYYMSNAMITYGVPAEGYHTSIPSGAVYKNAKGELTYLLYNAKSEDVDVKIYKDGIVIETIKVGAGRFYNSRIIGAQRPTVSITNYEDSDKIALNKTIKVEASASDKDGHVLSVDFYMEDQLIGTAYTEPFEIEYKPTVSGMKQLKAIATDNEGNKSEPFVLNIEVLATEQTPFNGTPWNIPQDKIRAVEFDHGGLGISCHDNEPEVAGGDNYRKETGVETENTANGDGNIGWTNTGEWLEYTVDVKETGVYAMSSNFSSAGGGAFRIFFDGVDMTGSVSVESTGSWGDYKDIHIADIPLKAGKQIMRVMIDRTGMNISSYKFTLLQGEKVPSEVNAGADQVIKLPETTATLSAKAETYNGSTIVSYEWKQLDSNSPVTIQAANQATTQVSGLQLGTYVFEVSIVDSNGFTASDEVVVVVMQGNFAPIANPGNSLTIPFSQKEVTLDGSKSYDPDGTIVKYEWEQIDSNNKLAISQENANPNATVTGFEEGKLYIFRLTVTDNGGASASENVRVYVEGINGISDAEQVNVSVYPNPFSDKLIVSIPENKEYEILKLYSVAGNVILQKDIRDMLHIELDTYGINKGYYILALISKGGESVTYKIVK